MRLLIIHGGKKLPHVLQNRMEEEGWVVTLAYTGMQGLSLAQAGRFDTIVMDIMLPEIDGFEIIRRLRHDNNRTPILVLTAQGDASDIVKGLNLGADDYVTKPISVIELMARIRAVSRRGPVPRLPKLQVADLTIDSSTCEVFRDNKRVPLTKKEYQLLELLLRNTGSVVRREVIADNIWGIRKSVMSSPVEDLIKLLRHKVDQGRAVKLIHTVRGFGYCVRG